jgi:hypothetical protein
MSELKAYTYDDILDGVANKCSRRRRSTNENTIH